MKDSPANHDEKLRMTVIDQDKHVRISFNARNQFLKMELLEAFDQMDSEMFRDTLIIVADVVEEQHIGKLLIDSQSLSSSDLVHLGGVESYPILVKISRSLEKLAVLCREVPVEAAFRRISQNVIGGSDVQTFLNEADAVDWTLGSRHAA